MIEEWKPVVGYEDLFEISNIGRLKSKRYKKEKILSQNLTKKGYYTHATKINGNNICFKIHRLVAEAFLPPPSIELLEWAKLTKNKVVLVNHIDGCKCNNNYTNLEWCNTRENAKHAINAGLVNLDNVRRAAKLQRTLTDNKVRYIKENYKPRHKEFGARALGRKYNTRHQKILDIINNLIYKDVE